MHQDISALAKSINAASGPEVLKTILCDFHILSFIQSTDTFTLAEFEQLCQIVTSKDGDISQLSQLNGWNTLQMVLKEAGKNIVISVRNTASMLSFSCNRKYKL